MNRAMRVVGALGVIFVSACAKSPQTIERRGVAAVPAPVAAKVPSTIAEALDARRAGKLESYEGGLRRLATSADPVERRRAVALLGVHFYEQKRYEEAADSLRQAIAIYPEVAPHLEVRLIDAEAERGNKPEAVSRAIALTTKRRGTTAAATAMLRLPALYAESGDRARMQESFEALTAVKIDEMTESDFVALADRLESSGGRTQAVMIRMRMLSEFPQGRFTERIYAGLAGDPAAPLDSLGFDESIKLAERLGRVNRYDQSLDLIGRIERRFPDMIVSPTLRFVRANALFNSRNYDRVILETPSKDDPYYLAIELLRARAFWRTDRNREFRDMALRIIRDYPKSDEATSAKLQLGKYYVGDEPDPAKATKYVEDAIAAGATGEQGENLWHLAWTYIVANDDKAISALHRYVVTYPDADYTTNSLFWLGKLHHKAGRIAERDASFNRLMADYPYSYYSYRARQILGVALFPPAETSSARQFPDISIEPDTTRKERLRVVGELLAIGFGAEAAREVKELAALYPDDLSLAYRLAELYVAAGQPLRANQLLQKKFREFVRHGGQNVPRRFWEILFPLSYWDEIRAAAEKNSIDPYLIPSIIRQESGFDPSVVSNAGAVGLMQLMPKEAARIAEIADLPKATREDLFNPLMNLTYGAAEYRLKLAEMKGNQTLAIAAYNAGEEAVRRWQARTPMDDLDFFIESIPFNETRLYVKNVTRNQLEYRRIYTEGN